MSKQHFQEYHSNVDDDVVVQSDVLLKYFPHALHCRCHGDTLE